MRFPAACALVGALIGSVANLGSAAESEAVSSATFERWMSELSNWGRWGDDDQLGTLNLITPETRVAAAQLVERGISVSLARNLATRQTQLSTYYPLEHRMHYAGLEPSDDMYSEDSFSIRYHRLAHSHLDALCHAFHERRMYNGLDQRMVKKEGCEALSVLAASKGIFTRGILIDIAWLKGVSYLSPKTAILPADLDAWSAKTGVEVRPGDVVVIRTGRWARRVAEALRDDYESLAGLHASSVKWLRERDVAAVGTDAGADVLPSRVEGQFAPVHKLLLVAMGTQIFDDLDLEELTKVAQRQSRWDFLFTAAPLRVPGGTGSPLNPIATF